MAVSHFFMTREDSASLVGFLIERFSAEFVPERSAHPPPFPRYMTLPEVESRIDQDAHYSRFAVLSAQWEEHPLAFNEIHANDGQHFFAMSQRIGGPSFDLILARTCTDGERQWIVAGWFSDFPYYIVNNAHLTDPSQYRTVPRPAAMTKAHKDVQNYLRRYGCRSVCREEGHSGPWILPGALHEFENGMWLRGGDWHYEPKGK